MPGASGARIRPAHDPRRRRAAHRAAEVLWKPGRRNTRAGELVVIGEEFERKWLAARPGKPDVGIRQQPLLRPWPPGSRSGEKPERIRLATLTHDFRLIRHGNPFEGGGPIAAAQPLNACRDEHGSDQGERETPEQIGAGQRHRAVSYAGEMQGVAWVRALDTCTGQGLGQGTGPMGMGTGIRRRACQA